YEMKSKKRWLFAMIVLALVTIFFTGSRSALIFAFINTTGYLFIKMLYEESKNRAYYFYVGLAVIAVFIVLIYLMFKSRLQGEIAFSQDYSLLIRFFLWKASIALIIKNPILGIGFGNFFFYHRETLNPLAVVFLRAGDHPHAHNIILHILTEMGIVGFIGVSAFAVWVIIRLIKRMRSKATWQEKKYIGIFLMAGFGFLGSQQFDLLMASPSHSRSILLVFMFLAVLHNIIGDKKLLIKS
ncbi:MAG TPA: O-antigen ligase domain-containing protein, partial [Calditrichaeota bacterium]|nr:O-antigen ligase domain-containing protein [Calditrichota bacterium]